MSEPRLGLPHLGFGVGLRTKHFAHIIREKPPVDWFEIVSENFMDSQGYPRHVLDQIAADYPIVTHGVSMSIGSTDPLDLDYLGRLKRFADDIKVAWVSDHVCWTGVGGANVHELIPIPFTDESLRHVVERIRTVQDILERPLVLENPSSYVTYVESTMSEWEFLGEMADQTGCGLLIDVANVQVSSFNHGFDPTTYLSALPSERIVQFHLAGYLERPTHRVDTHDRAVTDDVWDMYAYIYGRAGGASTLIEWDEDLPGFPVLQEQAEKAAFVASSVHLDLSN